MKLHIYFSILLLLLILIETILSRSAMQRIRINNHLWEVPNEFGWEEVLKEVTEIQQLLHDCPTAAECHRLVKYLRTIFQHYPVSRTYFESNQKNADDTIASIFKWG
ncbi:unnamed protein product [Rotaria magnacalcarata]|uniref:Uncharacterized protein n=2 Tax=Rotaria magnacalcarata TaxID=392030 RepID=A0A816V4Y6_9BILA|nr:unnamed protein product [Rotaria magnacalcarata]CAF2118310.1 unnamed protein product [Rotaria magnacalcarata]CAF4193969.1 unnamed protein product [Rotaria magnacalcarata]CAF4490477.1 unnamed protein product [Rotaria magnacalcarata]